MSEGIGSVTRRCPSVHDLPREACSAESAGRDQHMLLPAKNEVARHLRRYRTWERVMLASPTDRAARDNFEDSGYTLCVLMGKRCAREAVTAAERYLQTSLPAYLQEQTGRPKQEQTGKTRKDQSGRPRKDQSGRARSARRGPPSGRRFTAGR